MSRTLTRSKFRTQGCNRVVSSTDPARFPKNASMQDLTLGFSLSLGLPLICRVLLVPLLLFLPLVDLNFDY